MAPPDATPKSLFPGAPAAAAEPAPGAFATPATVEFPHVDLEEADMSAFGSRVQADKDADLLDARLCHVREVRYGPGSQPADGSPVVPLNAPVTPTHEGDPESAGRGSAGRGMAVALLVGAAVGLLVAAVGVFLFFLLT